MNYKELLAVLSLLLACSGYIPYIKNILKGKTKPHAYTWLVWEAIAIVGFGIQVQDGGGAGTWLLGLTTLATLFIFILSLRYGHKDIHIADKISLGFSVVAFAFWILADQPLMAAILISIIEGVGGFLPTFRKSYKLPHEETMASYIMYSFSIVCSLIALDKFTAAGIIYPMAVFFFNVSFVVFLVIRRNKLPLVNMNN